MAMIAGTIYGVALNDSEHYTHLASSFEEPPYRAPPKRPVLYIKSRNCLCGDRGIIPLPGDLRQIEASPTLGLLIGRDASRVAGDAALNHVAGACLVLDISEPSKSYYRPPIRQRCRDGFLRLGDMAEFDEALLAGTIETSVNDGAAHQWNLGRLFRSAPRLIAEMSNFMTLAAGDLLLIGTPFESPLLAANDRIVVRSGRLPLLSAQVRAESRS